MAPRVTAVYRPMRFSAVEAIKLHLALAGTWYTLSERQKALAAMTGTAAGDDDSLEPAYRLAKPISFELVQHAGIFFEEKLCSFPICHMPHAICHY